MKGHWAALSSLLMMAAASSAASPTALAGLLGMFAGSTGGYDFIDLSALMLAVYVASFLAYRRGWMTVRAHRMVWNLLLLFTFLICAILGVLLVLKINYGVVYVLPFNMLYWHVEAGIAMSLISVFHILWHLEYFKAMLRAPKRRTTS